MSLNNDDIKQLIAILQRGLSEEKEPTEPSNQISEKPTRQTKKRRRTSQKEAPEKETPASYNKFDSMPEHNMHKDDSKIDQLLMKFPPTQRARQFEYMDVVCRVCGKKESVNPALIYDSPNRYKCNKCARVPG